MRPTPDNPAATTVYHHRSGVLLAVVSLLSGLLAVFVLAALFGPGFGFGSSDQIWAAIIGLSLLGIITLFVWLLWRRPVVMVVDRYGIHLPLTFTRPLRWDEIHRIRLLSHGKHLFGDRKWMIVDPSPGVLAPIRFKTWRKLDLWFQRHHGVRIPLHGLDADAGTILEAIERFRPVTRGNG